MSLVWASNFCPLHVTGTEPSAFLSRLIGMTHYLKCAAIVTVRELGTAMEAVALVCAVLVIWG